MRRYCYRGYKAERIPIDVTHVTIDPGVTTIKKEAFGYCTSMVSVRMGDHVKRIESQAFIVCTRLKFVQLSRSLEFIGYGAFWRCESLVALFLPPTVMEIGDFAFYDCRSLKVLKFPTGIQPANIGKNVIDSCQTLFNRTIVRYERNMNGFVTAESDFAVKYWLVALRNDIFPFHAICHETYVSAEMVNEYINRFGNDCVYEVDCYGMSALHILALNPHASTEAVLSCFDANENAVFDEDDEGYTPIDYARHHNVQGLLALLEALIIKWSVSTTYESTASRKRKR